MALTPPIRKELGKLYNALADRVLEPGDPVYVAQVNSRPGGADAVEEIVNEIGFREGGGVSLFTGQRGTGKSTELRRLKRRLQDELGATVYYADLAQYLLLTKEVEISDFLVCVAGALSDEIQAQFQASPGDIGYWDRFRAFLGTTVQVQELSASLGGVEIKAALKNDPVFKLRVQESARGHVTQLIEQAHAFFAESVAFVRSQVQDPGRKVVLILDSVERIRGVGAESMKVYESVRNLFLAHAEHLKIPLLHVVYTVPPYLSILAAGAGSLMGGAAVRRLVSTHIFEDRSRAPDQEGLTVLRRVIGTRYADWEKLLTSEALDRLALSSGGDLRELFRLVRLCLPAVRDDAQLPLSVAGVKPAEEAARNEMMPIPEVHLSWLQRITQTHDTCLKKDEDLPVLAHFLDNRLVLNYRNGSDWYDVHPLLRDAVDRHVISPGA